MAKFSTSQDEILIEEIQKYSAIYDYESESYKNFLVKENAWKKIAFSVKKDVDDCKKRWKSIKDTYFRHKRKLQLGTGSSASEKPIKWNLYQSLSFLDKVKHERKSIETLEFDKSQMTDESELNEANGSILNFDEIEPIESFYPSTQSATAKKENSVTGDSDCPTTSASRCSSAASSSTHRPISQVKRFRGNNSKDGFLKRFEERAQKRTELLEALHQKTENTKQEIELDEIDLFMKSISLTVKKLPQPLIHEAKLGILTLFTNLEARTMSSNASQADHNPSTNLEARSIFSDTSQTDQYNPDTNLVVRAMSSNASQADQYDFSDASQADHNPNTNLEVRAIFSDASQADHNIPNTNFVVRAISSNVSQADQYDSSNASQADQNTSTRKTLGHYFHSYIPHSQQPPSDLHNLQLTTPTKAQNSDVLTFQRL